MLQEVERLGQDKMEWAKKWIHNGLLSVEKSVKPKAGKYCIGDSISLADVCLVPQLYNAVRFGVDLSSFPTLSLIHDNLKDHPAFVAAHPDNQPDKQ